MKKITFYFAAVVLLSSVAFSQWTEQPSGQTSLFYSVSGADDNNAWICGAAGKVLRTTNGGTTWTLTTSPTAGDLYNIFGYDANIAFTTSSPSATFVYRTTNGGTNWTQVFTQAGGFIDAIWMTSATNGFMYGDPVGGRWSLWRTTNGGVNWDSTGLYVAQVSGEAGWNNAMYVSGNNIWFGTNSVRLYYSSNNGANWTAQTTPATNQYAVWFNNATTGLAGGANLYITTNGGTAWSNLTSLGSGNVAGITGSGNSWFFVRQTTSIYKSTNNGANWVSDYTAPAGNHTHIAKALNGNRLWAVRTNGGISKSDQLIGITPISNEIPAVYSLSQNYPNPFNPQTKIEFAIPSSSNVALKVFNMLGKETATIYSGYLGAGKYSVDFNASELSSGVYFYTISAGTFTETKKMILVK